MKAVAVYEATLWLLSKVFNINLFVYPVYIANIFNSSHIRKSTSKFTLFTVSLMIENHLVPQPQYHTDCKMIVQKDGTMAPFDTGNCVHYWAAIHGQPTGYVGPIASEMRTRVPRVGCIPPIFAMRPALIFPKCDTKIQAVQIIIILSTFTQK